MSAVHCERSFSSNKSEFLKIEPSLCLHDEIMRIEGKNLPQEVTLTSCAEPRSGQIFFTYSHYKTRNGTLDLSVDKSIGGTWKGLFPMGPIANLEPGPESRKYIRFMKKDVTTPFTVTFKLLRNHLSCKESYNPDPALIIDSCIHERLYMAPGVQRIPVKGDKIHGTLFLPEGDGPFPGVIDLFGTAGGLIEFRAAQLASKGIATLALAYLGYADLPPSLGELKEINISYFQEAADFLLSHEKVKKCGIGVVGVSKGGDLACSLGAFIPEVKAVVCISGFPTNTWCKMITKDKVYPGLMFDISRGKIVNDELLNVSGVMHDSKDYPESWIPIHESNAKFLFVVGSDDANWDTKYEVQKGVERLQEHGKENYQVLEYEGAGHLIEPPYAPFSYATFHKLVGAAMVWGGDAKGHHEAQIQSWKKIVEFFKVNL